MTRRATVARALRWDLIEGTAGKLVFATSEKGLVFAGFCAGVGDAERLLRSEFPGAELKRDREGLGVYARALGASLEGRHAPSGLPLDLEGTEFQRQVWKALRKIPAGRTTSYAELARKIGRPKAVRAAAAACGANPVSLIVPCHRVIGSTGKLTGYRWGIERKQALLTLEGALR